MQCGRECLVISVCEYAYKTERLRNNDVRDVNVGSVRINGIEWKHVLINTTYVSNLITLNESN